MTLYKVRITRVEYQFAEIEVEADSAEEAKAVALAEADDYVTANAEESVESIEELAIAAIGEWPVDPNANLKEMLELANDLLDVAEKGSSYVPEAAIDLADKIVALDNWIKAGGFLPDAWNKEGNRP